MENMVNHFTNIKSKKILIFGNTGFVGSWLSIALKLLGANVLGFSLKMRNKNYISNTTEYKKLIPTIFCNILNIKKVEKELIRFKPDIVIHLASQPIVEESFKNPEKTFQTNIIGTVKILEFLKRIKTVKKIIIFTSDKVYKNNNTLLNEESQIGGIDPYSASKSCQDIISQSYNHIFIKKEMIILRSGNIIGGGDWGYKRLFPDIVRAFINKKNVQIRSINSNRPWTHILEVLNAILTILNKKSKNKNYTQIYNLSSKASNQVSVKKIIHLLKQNTQMKSLKIKKIQNLIKEKKYLQLSSKKIEFDYGLKKKLNLIESLKLTIDHYLSKNNQLYGKTKEQILNYFK